MPVLILTWSYSHSLFMMKLPTERLESVLLGTVAGLEFFGCVPRELWWDNPTTLATAILKGRERRINERYAALASHYCFDPKFCMPASGWEKPDVEHRVYDLQRRFATPVPKVKDDDELNAWLRQCCAAEMQRTVSGRTQTIGQMFEEEKAALLHPPTGAASARPGALPAHRFDPCVFASGKVDHYQTVRYDKARYSVPRQCPRLAFGGGGGGSMVTIKAYADRIEIVAAGQVVAQHPRRYDAGLQLDPLHYWATLARRPMALDHADLYRQWQLPPAFNELRQKFEARHGASTGVRHFIQVLQLLAEHPLPRVQQAVETALGSAAAMPPNAAPTAEASQAQAPHACLIGEPGTGKTHCAIALGLAACRAGKRVRFFTTAQLVTRLEETQKQYQLDRFLTQLDKADLLIVEELGYLSFSRAGAELLFQVFADRYERASLLITSNLAFGDWGQIFQGERMTAALLDRLTHRCHIFQMNGESYRFRESAGPKKERHKTSKANPPAAEPATA